MPVLAPHLIVVLAGFAAVAVTGLIIVLGGWAVRWLRLPNDPPEEIAFEPLPPPPCAAGDPAVARARAAAGALAFAQGRQVSAACAQARNDGDLAEWIAQHDPARAAAARAAAGMSGEAATQAASACKAGDAAVVAAALLKSATASEQLRALAAGLPDARAAERRKLLILAGLLAAALAAAVLTFR